MKLLLPLCWIVALFATHGCTHLVNSFGLLPEPPKVSFEDAAIKSANFSLVEADITIAVKNIDPRPLQIWGLNFDLFIEDEAIGTGALPSKLDLNAGDTKTLVIPIGIKPSSAVGSLMKIIETRSLPNASIRGDLTIDSWLGAIRLPFDRKIHSNGN